MLSEFGYLLQRGHGACFFEKRDTVTILSASMTFTIAFGKGNVRVRLSGVQSSAGVLQNVLFVPKAAANYVSVKAATSRGVHDLGLLSEERWQCYHNR